MSSSVQLRVAAIQTRSCDPDSATRDSDSYSQRVEYTGDSKTDPWDDSKIRTGLYSKDQTAIWFRNRVISCECLFVAFLFIYFYQRVYYLFIYLNYVIVLSFHVLVLFHMNIYISWHC